MASINRKLVMAFTTGIVLAVILYLLGSIALAVIPDLPAVTPLASAGVGLGGAIAATLAEDTAENKTT